MLSVRVVVNRIPPSVEITVSQKNPKKEESPVFSEEYAEEIYFQICDGIVAAYERLGIKMKAIPFNGFCTRCWGNSNHACNTASRDPNDKFVTFSLNLSELSAITRLRIVQNRPLDPCCEVRCANIDLTVMANLLKHKELIVEENKFAILPKQDRKAYYDAMPAEVASPLLFKEDRDHTKRMIKMTKLYVDFIPFPEPNFRMRVELGSKMRNGCLTCRHIPNMMKQITKGMKMAYQKLELNSTSLKDVHKKKTDSTDWKGANVIKFMLDISDLWLNITPLHIYSDHAEADFVRDVLSMNLADKTADALVKRKRKLFTTLNKSCSERKKVSTRLVKETPAQRLPLYQWLEQYPVTQHALEKGALDHVLAQVCLQDFLNARSKFKMDTLVSFENVVSFLIKSTSMPSSNVLKSEDIADAFDKAKLKSVEILKHIVDRHYSSN
ncbi:hypothetical protein HDE_09516 [Halotydeus destructor]|nr:hypothetical protein HDE_09516 [Halotydeus destructor]